MRPDFVTHTFPLREVSEALQTAEKDKERVIKVAVTVDATNGSR